VDFSHTKISPRRSLWSYSKVQHIASAWHHLINRIPALRYGVATNVYKRDGNCFCDYVCWNNFGFYSNLSTALQDILTLYRANINVNRIDYSVGMNWFKHEIGKDVYLEFFARLRSGILDIPKGLQFNAFDVHKVYKQLPLGDLCKAASMLFYPSSSVMNMVNTMITSSGLSPERSVAIVYRGTDKSSELRQPSIDDYIQVANKILRQGPPDLDVVIQTDQEQARDKIAASFGGRCRFFNELPVTRGNIAIHQLEFGTEIMMDREEFAKRIMAAAIILSRCAYIITYTGNVGAWIAIYRGTPTNLYQFDANAQLQTP
jgi:hypothetical protein